jgi:DHA2 family multidrug resistance protein
MTAAAIAASAYAPPEVNKWVVALSIAFGSLMATIDSSIVNVAVPHIRGSVGATVEEITWVTTAYIVAMVLVMPLTGLLGALLGQKRLYLGSLVLFVLGSVLCGMARSLPALVVVRVLQGLGAGALQPSQQAIMRQTFPAAEQGMAMAIFSMVIMIGPAIGPTLGGYITDNWAWPWIFYINVPIGVLGVLMTWKNVHEPVDVRLANAQRAAGMRANMDWLGIALMAVGISTLQFFLEEGPAKDWLESTPILVTGVVAFVALTAFVIRELSFSHPVVNLRLFADKTFASATAIGAVVFAALMGSMFLLPVFMQELMGYDATESGIALMPRSLAMLVVTPVVGKLYSRVPPALLIAFGALTFVVGNLQLSHITLASSTADVVMPLAISGVGLACLMIPLMTAALTHIARKDLADAAGLTSFVRQIGGSIGLTIFATLLSRFASQAKVGVAAQVTLLRPEVQAQFAASLHQVAARIADPNLAHALTIKMLAGRVAVQSMVLAFEKSFLLQGLVFFAVLPLLVFLKTDKPTSGAHVELSVE